MRVAEAERQAEEAAAEAKAAREAKATEAEVRAARGKYTTAGLVVCFRRGTAQTTKHVFPVSEKSAIIPNSPKSQIRESSVQI